MINEIGEVIILLQRPLLQRPNAIRFNQNLFRSEWIHVGFDDEPICLVRKDWREVIEECTRRPYFDSGKIQWKKPVFNNFSKFFLNYLQNIGRWWDETFGKPLLVLPAPYFSANNDERAVRRIRWLEPQFWNQKRCLPQQSPGKGDISAAIEAF